MQEAKQQRTELPPIPKKRYFSIGEASRLCGVRPHVLRYWEQEFSQLEEVQRRGNRRYYQEKDIVILRQIRRLLYDLGFTIEGARKRLSQLGKRTPEKTTNPDTLKEVIQGLEETLTILRA